MYFYPHEHYTTWERLLATGPLPPGSFGENITSEGLLEEDLNIGDTLQIGTATLQVRQPRSPCYKLQVRFARSDMTALFLQQAKPGWYASVIEEGTFAAADAILVRYRAPESMTVADVWRYSMLQNADGATRKRIGDIELLPTFWKNKIERHASR